MQDYNISRSEQDILNLLIENRSDYFSSQYIAQKVNLSSKTVRKYIKRLNTILRNSSTEIIVKRGSGYRLIINDGKQFGTLMSKIDYYSNVTNDVRYLNNNEDRERYILNSILIENNRQSVYEYAKEMFVSESTINNVIYGIKDKLSDYDLDISVNKHSELLILGTEKNIRRFIIEYFFSSGTFNDVLFYDLSFSNFNSVEQVMLITLEECRNYDLQLSDYILENLILHIVLAVIRIKSGHIIQHNKKENAQEKGIELEVAEKIVSRLESELSITFPLGEAENIAMHLRTTIKKDYLSLSNMEETYENEKYFQVTYALNELIKSGLKFNIDQKLVQGLIEHINLLLNRLASGISAKNPLLEEVIERYNDEFAIIKNEFEQLSLLSSYEIDNHEWAYITLHILAAMERYNGQEKLNVIVICTSGLGSAQMLKARLENEFSDQINIKNVISYYELASFDLTDIDLILTTIDITNNFYNAPIIRVSVFLNDEDIQVINKFIKRSNFDGEAYYPSKAIEETEIENIFSSFFSEARFVVFNQGKENNKESIVDTLINKLSDSKSDDFKEKLHNQLLLREEFGSVAFSNDVAFPHPAEAIGLESEIVVGIVPDGCQWDSEHGNIKFVFLMSLARVGNKGINKINKTFTKFIANQEVQARILENPTFSTFKKSFLSLQTENALKQELY